jgi:hypothetical protein
MAVLSARSGGELTEWRYVVSARARQLNHRLKNRRTAILSRRENDASLQSQQKSPHSPLWRDFNGTEPPLVNGTVRSNPQSPPSGFVAVNTPRSGMVEPVEDNGLSSQFLFSHPNADNITIINGTSIKGASPTTRAELMKKFFTTADRQARGYPPEGEPPAQYGRQSSRPRPRASEGGEYASFVGAAGTVAIPSTPSALLPQPKLIPHYERDDGGPYKMEMVARMEELQRGERILPPCDRCRRLHMDCLKNLTACMGCTKKHAKCSWKDVKEEELQEQRSLNLVRDHIDDSQRDHAITATGGGFTMPDRDRDAERNGHVSSSNGVRADSTSSAPVPSDPHPGPRESAPRRAASEIQGSTIGSHDRRISVYRSHPLDHEDDDPDANSRLMEAIRETVDHHARVAAGKDREHDMNGEREREREWERERERDRKIRSS